MPTDRVYRTTRVYPKEESAAPQASPVDRNTRSHKNRRCEGRQSDRRARLRCPWAAGPGQTTSRRAEHNQPRRPHRCGGRRGDWRAQEGLAAVPVGGGGAWPGSTQTPRPIGGRREACGAWPGFEPTRRAKLAARTASGRAGRAAAGDLSGQQAATRCADGSRAGRHPRAHQAARPASTHNDTRPRPVSRPRPRHAHAAPFTTAPPAIRRSCPRDPQPRRGQPRGGRRGRGTGSRTRSRHPRCGRSGSTAGRHRARHTRRA